MTLASVPDRVDVLIVGAGPTGLTLAAELASCGVDHCTIDKSEGPEHLSKACVLQPGVLSVLADRGLFEEIDRRGLRIPSIAVISNGRLLARTRLKHLRARFPFEINIAQHETEAILHGYGARHGSAPHYGCELLAVEPSETGVRAEVSDASGARKTVTCRYLAGCDGSHSKVRTEAGIAWNTKRYPQGWMIMEAPIEWPMPPNETIAVFGAKRYIGVFPMPGGTARIFGMLPDDSEAEKYADPAFVAEALSQDIRATVRLGPRTWSSRYHVAHGMCGQHRKGPVVIAGDAAHVHSPESGLGMNSGVMDSINLGWKLAAILKHGAPDSLLDSYNDERQAAAKALLQISNRIHTIDAQFQGIGRRVGGLAMHAFTAFLEHAPLQLEAMTLLDMPSVKSPLLRGTQGHSGVFVRPVGPGRRMPDAHAVCAATGERVRLRGLVDTGHWLIVALTGPSREAHASESFAALSRFASDHAAFVRLTVVTPDGTIPTEVASESAFLDPAYEAHEAFQSTTHSAIFVIRPDGFIGVAHRGLRADDVLDYFADNVGVARMCSAD